MMLSRFIAEQVIPVLWLMNIEAWDGWGLISKTGIHQITEIHQETGAKIIGVSCLSDMKYDIAVYPHNAPITKNYQSCIE